MSASIQVFLQDTKLPSVAARNAAIKAEGFDLVLDPFDLRKDDGYRPAELHGRESGFEWYLSKVADLTEDPDYPFKQKIGDCDVRASLDFTSQADEAIASIVAGAVLAKLSDGYFWDPETEPHRFYRGDDAIQVAREAVQEWERRRQWPPWLWGAATLVAAVFGAALWRWRRSRRASRERG